MTTEKAPEVLSESSAELWRGIVAKWALTRPDLELLSAGLQALDTHNEAMATVRREGSTITNPDSGNTRQHPALAVAHASLRAYRQVLAALRLEHPDPMRHRRGSASRTRR